MSLYDARLDPQRVDGDLDIWRDWKEEELGRNDEGGK
jgi:hypothetical protein